MDVTLCFDQHFALPGALSILSLLQSNPGVRVHAITEADDRTVALIREIADAHEADVRIISRAPEATHVVDAASDYGTYSTATYRRLFLPDLLPDLDRILFIDADTIVRGDLRALWEEDLAGALVAAVPDPWASGLDSFRARYPQGYFNAGMLLIDLAAWRAEGVTARCLQLVREAVETGASEFHDQTPLNDAMVGRWRRVSHRWNFTGIHSARLAAELGISGEDHQRAASDPAIVHFLAAYKPWIPGFESVTRWHVEYAALSRALETRFNLHGLRWPGAFVHNRQIATQRRVMALRLVASARARGLDRPTVLLTGLLAHEIGVVAREQGYAIAGFTSEYSAMQGGRLLDLPIQAIDDALDSGARDFIVGDYRRLARMRAPLIEGAAQRGVDIRLVDLDASRSCA